MDNINKFIRFIIICALFSDCKLLSVNVAPLKLGSECFHNGTKTLGVCKLVGDNCPYTHRNFYTNDVDPEICGYAGKLGSDLLICCPNDDTTTDIPLLSVTRPINAKKSQAWCKTYTNITNPVDGIHKSLCGSLGTRLIHNGIVAKGKEFPHMALIGYGERQNIKWHCGGSLISDQWVLTAAHCGQTNTGDAAFIRLGELNYLRTDDDAAIEDFDIIDVRIHPEKRDSHYNDIALVKMDRRVMFNAYIRPACLWPTKELQSNNRPIIAGWGYKNHTDLETSSELLKAVVSFKSVDECNQQFHNENRLLRGIDDDLQVCAGSDNNEEIKDSCQGDSGGPLMVTAEPEYFCMYYIVGVTSFGKPCGYVRRPSVYVRVSTYVPWIESIVWP